MSAAHRNEFGKCQADGVKEFYRIGADVNAGAELDEFGRLLVDLHFESLPAERDAAASPPSPAPTIAIRRAFAISRSADLKR